ncbi:MAG: hypothetical protein DI611_12345 [Brachybacterium faecium]|nr:MAG: hypothetical protein DI611_12345 [Brachybacterium faecium]
MPTPPRRQLLHPHLRRAEKDHHDSAIDPVRTPPSRRPHPADPAPDSRERHHSSTQVRKTLRRWRKLLLAYFDTNGASNGGIEAIDAIIKLGCHIAHGFRKFEHY